MNTYEYDGFDGRNVAVEESEELNTLVVALSDTQDGSGDVIMLQKALSFDEQDRALGQDTYCISTSSGATVYGGLLRCSLLGDVLTLDLTPEAADALGVTRTCRFRLVVDPASINRLREGLRRVLAGGASASVDLEL